MMTEFLRDSLPTAVSSSNPLPTTTTQLPTTLGVKTAANSTSVTLSSDGAFSTNFGAIADTAATNDTGSFSLMSFVKRGMQNWTSLLAKFSATASTDANRLPVAQLDGGTLSGTVTSAAVLFTTSMLNYESVTVQVISAGTSCAITYETSDDNLTWVGCAGLSTTTTGTYVPSLTSSTLGILQFARRGLYFRARVSSYGSGTVTIAGTLSKTPSISALPAIYSTSTEGGAVSSGLFGVVFEGRTTSKTSVSNAQFVRPIATQDGRQIVRLNSIPENEWQYAAASGGITNTTDVVLQAAAGSGIKNYLTGLSLGNANATATEVVVKDGSTVIWRMYLAANAPIQSIKFVTPLQSTANTALNVACITTGTQTYINAQGYKAP